MKILKTIFVLLIVFLLTFLILAQKTLSYDDLNQENIDPKATGIEENTENYMPTEEEDSVYFREDIFLRKLDDKKLPPLSNKEKIIWAFRLAETNPFL